MVIFGVTLVWSFTNLKCSTNGWPWRSELADHLHAALPWSHAGELDALVGLVALDAAEPSRGNRNATRRGDIRRR